MSGMPELPAGVDPALWLALADESLAFIDAGSRGVGRFVVYIPDEPFEYRGRTVGLDEVERCSVESSYWLHGLLAGARPEHWFDEDYPHEWGEKVGGGVLIHPDEREVLYQTALDRLEKTGLWRMSGSDPCEVCGNTYFPERPDLNLHLPSDPWDGCWEDGTIDLDACWPEVVDVPPWEQ